MKTIAYFIGQFPGPTHTFFWREVRALRNLGVSVDLVSTRLPVTELAPHAWVHEAVAQTEYLFPLSIKSFFECILLIIVAGPKRWLNCIKSILQADGMNLAQRVRLAAMILAGARLALSGRQRGWEHVHVGFCADAANVALFAKLLTDLPYSLTLHATLDEFGPNQRQKWSHAAFGMAVAHNLAAELHQKLKESVPKSLTVISMGVETSSFLRSKPYLPWTGDGTARIFCAARLTPHKGHRELIRAIAHLRDRGVEINLRLAGEDITDGRWYTAELRQLLNSLDLADKVDFLGTIPEDVVQQELESAHVFVLASYAEGMSVAVMEAMAMGVPVVVTNVDGLVDLVDNGVDGLFVEPGNPEQLFECLLFLLKDPQLAVELSDRSRAKVERSFRSDQSASVLLQGIYGRESREQGAGSRGSRGAGEAGEQGRS